MWPIVIRLPRPEIKHVPPDESIIYEVFLNLSWRQSYEATRTSTWRVILLFCIWETQSGLFLNAILNLWKSQFSILEAPQMQLFSFHITLLLHFYLNRAEHFIRYLTCVYSVCLSSSGLRVPLSQWLETWSLVILQDPSVTSLNTDIQTSVMK